MNIDEKILLLTEVYGKSDTDLEAQAQLRKLYSKHQVLWIMEQRTMHAKAKGKLELWFNNKAIFTLKAMEQSTNPKVALAKAKIIGKNSSLISLTGGFGVDDWALSKYTEKLISIDSDAELNAHVCYNFNQLDIANVTRITSTAENWLANNTLVEAIYYIDPDRRSKSNIKGLNAELFSPNVLELFNKYPHIKRNCWIKLSPATDLQWIWKNIDSKATLYIIEFAGEVKEILVHTAANTIAQINLVYVHENGEFTLINETEIMSLETPIDGDCIFYPSPAAIKSSLLQSDELCNMLFLQSISSSKTLFITKYKQITHLGQLKPIVFETDNLQDMQKFMKQNEITGAGITCRNFPLKPDALRKKMQLKENAHYQLFASINYKEKYFVLCMN